MAAFLFFEMMVKMALLIWRNPCQNRMLEITWGAFGLCTHVKTQIVEITWGKKSLKSSQSPMLKEDFENNMGYLAFSYPMLNGESSK